eukprot:1862204-Amphidinium_carterae.1
MQFLILPEWSPSNAAQLESILDGLNEQFRFGAIEIKGCIVRGVSGSLAIDTVGAFEQLERHGRPTWTVVKTEWLTVRWQNCRRQRPVAIDFVLQWE